MTKISQSSINRKLRHNLLLRSHLYWKKKWKIHICCKLSKIFNVNMIMSIFPTYVSIKISIASKTYSYCTTVKSHLFYQTIVVTRLNPSDIGNIAEGIVHISFVLSPCLNYITPHNIFLEKAIKHFQPHEGLQFSYAWMVLNTWCMTIL